MVFFCNRGCEKLCEMWKDDFIAEVHIRGEKYASFCLDKMTKKHYGNDNEQSQRRSDVWYTTASLNLTCGFFGEILFFLEF